MAYVPKPTTVTTTAPAQASRAVVPHGRVAAVSTAQVDSLESGAAVAFDAAQERYFDKNQGYTELGDGGDRRQRSFDPGFNRLFTSDSEAFAEIFQGELGRAGTGGDGNALPRFKGAPVSKVINTYETNALVIAGEQPVRGTSFSFSL